jgi:hypothetical protein
MIEKESTIPILLKYRNSLLLFIHIIILHPDLSRLEVEIFT